MLTTLHISEKVSNSLVTPVNSVNSIVYETENLDVNYRWGSFITTITVFRIPQNIQQKIKFLLKQHLTSLLT